MLGSEMGVLGRGGGGGSETIWDLNWLLLGGSWGLRSSRVQVRGTGGWIRGSEAVRDWNRGSWVGGGEVGGLRQSGI